MGRNDRVKAQRAAQERQNAKDKQKRKQENIKREAEEKAAKEAAKEAAKAAKSSVPAAGAQSPAKKSGPVTPAPAVPSGSGITTPPTSPLRRSPRAPTTPPPTSPVKPRSPRAPITPPTSLVKPRSPRAPATPAGSGSGNSPQPTSPRSPTKRRSQDPVGSVTPAKREFPSGRCARRNSGTASGGKYVPPAKRGLLPEPAIPGTSAGPSPKKRRGNDAYYLDGRGVYVIGGPLYTDPFPTELTELIQDYRDRLVSLREEEENLMDILEDPNISQDDCSTANIQLINNKQNARCLRQDIASMEWIEAEWPRVTRDQCIHDLARNYQMKFNQMQEQLGKLDSKQSSKLESIIYIGEIMKNAFTVLYKEIHPFLHDERLRFEGDHIRYTRRNIKQDFNLYEASDAELKGKSLKEQQRLKDSYKTAKAEAQERFDRLNEASRVKGGRSLLDRSGGPDKLMTIRNGIAHPRNASFDNVVLFHNSLKQLRLENVISEVEYDEAFETFYLAKDQEDARDRQNALKEEEENIE